MSTQPADNPETRELTDRVRRALTAAALEPGPPRSCPYLPRHVSRDVAFQASQLPAGVFQSLMALNFRRSGTVIYRPACPECRQCQAIRVLVDAFTPNRAQRRCRRDNSDVSVEVRPPEPTEEKHWLFQRYLRARHGDQMSGSWESFTDFLYTSPVSTLEVVHRLDDRLIGIGILDVEPNAASTVYFYFEPDLPGRSLGVFNVLWSIDWCRRRGLPHLYLGYYIRDCAKMNYKTNYRPCEILETDGRWRLVPARHARRSDR